MLELNVPIHELGDGKTLILRIVFTSKNNMGSTFSVTEANILASIFDLIEGA